jgi:hypothetical protein
MIWFMSVQLKDGSEVYVAQEAVHENLCVWTILIGTMNVLMWMLNLPSGSGLDIKW